jgi:hypothetical protein
MNGGVVVTSVYGAEDDVAILREVCEAAGLDLVVYDKLNACARVLGDRRVRCIPLANVGREQGTFVRYVLDHYDRLPDTVYFVPTPLDKHDRLRRFMALLASGKTGCEDWTLSGLDDFTIGFHDGRDLVPAAVRPFRAWYDAFVGPWVPWDPAGPGPAYNGVMRTSRARILARPRAMYEALASQLAVHTDTEVAHYMERAMGAVF